MVGYDDTVIPQLVNAILAKHNFITSRLARPGQDAPHPRDGHRLDQPIPAVPGSEIHDDPPAVDLGARPGAGGSTEGDALPIEGGRASPVTSRSSPRPT